MIRSLKESIENWRSKHTEAKLQINQLLRKIELLEAEAKFVKDDSFIRQGGKEVSSRLVQRHKRTKSKTMIQVPTQSENQPNPKSSQARPQETTSALPISAEPSFSVTKSQNLTDLPQIEIHH